MRGLALWLLTMIALAACDAAEPPVDAAVSSGAAMWGKDYFPNIALTTQDGARVRFFDDLIKDKVVLVNFIYTHCTDSCPMETARLLEVQQLLGDRLGKDIFFYSISIDPVHDTPATLKAYAAAWHTGPGWTFLTGADDDVTRLRQKLGVYEPDRKKQDHGTSLVIGNQQTGRWMKRSPAENPYVIADQLGSWLHNWKRPSTARRDYADAPEIRNISSGEEMFRARCGTCHTAAAGETGSGGASGEDTNAPRIGPDLHAVTQHRDHAWLVRWIMAPDQVLASGDPIATGLLAAYHGLPMPNLRMSLADAELVLGYLDHAGEAPLAPARHKLVVAAADAPAVRALLGRYDALRLRLADDDLDGARRLAAAMPEAAGPVSVGAQAIAAAADLDAARAGFAALSRTLVGVLADNPLLQRGYWLFRCPHAPGYQHWLQADGALTNPYFGLKMRSCGSQAPRWTAE